MSVADDCDAIRDILHRYCRHLDARDTAALLSDVYTVDAVDDRRRGAPLRGHAELRAYFDRALVGLEATAHLLSNIEIDVTGDNARALSRVLACHWFLNAASDGWVRPSECVLVAEYSDRLTRLPQGWRITHRTLTALGPGGLLAGTMPDTFAGFGGVTA